MVGSDGVGWCGMGDGVADTAPGRTRGRARTIVPAHPSLSPQVLESGILQRISPEERKRQEVRAAWDMPGSAAEAPKAVGHTWLCQGRLQVELGSAQFVVLLLPAAPGLGSGGRAHLHKLVGKQAAPLDAVGKGKHLHAVAFQRLGVLNHAGVIAVGQAMHEVTQRTNMEPSHFQWLRARRVQIRFSN